MIILIDEGKTFDRIQLLFRIRTLHKVDIEGIYLNITKSL